MRGSLCGYVVRGDTERPLEKAVVQAFVGEDLAPRTALTDRAGWFALDGLPPGIWLLRACGPAPDGQMMGKATAPVFDNAFSDVTIRVVASPGGDYLSGEKLTAKGWVKHMQHGSVNGNVVRADTGEPVQDASISVAKGAGPAPDIAPLSDAQGRFVLDGLPAGDWTLRARSPDNQTGEARVQVVAGKTASIRILVQR